MMETKTMLFQTQENLDTGVLIASQKKPIKWLPVFEITLWIISIAFLASALWC
jgi:hypothetical protein